MLEAQEQSQARLLRLKAELHKSDKCREMQNGAIEQKHKLIRLSIMKKFL